MAASTRGEGGGGLGEEEYFSFSPCKGIWILESWKFLLVVSGILGFGIRNTAIGVQSPTINNWNAESKFH